MENATKALQIAGDILVFMLAFSLAIVSFNKVRATSELLVSYRDRETLYIDGNLYYAKSTNTLNRSVGLNDIVPTICRAFSENYKVVFDTNIGEVYTDAGNIPVYSIDFATGSTTLQFADDADKIEFLKLLLYGGNATEFNSKHSVTLNTGLYNRLSEILKNNHTITESLGVYYTNDSTNTPDVNKTEARIITYTISN